MRCPSQHDRQSGFAASQFVLPRDPVTLALTTLQHKLNIKWMSPGARAIAMACSSSGVTSSSADVKDDILFCEPNLKVNTYYRIACPIIACFYRNFVIYSRRERLVSSPYACRRLLGMYTLYTERSRADPELGIKMRYVHEGFTSVRLRSAIILIFSGSLLVESQQL